MSRVFIGIGSNEGERLRHISRALAALGTTPGLRVVQLATLMESEPVGGPPQGAYLNTVAELDTSMAPGGLLATLKAIERTLGRLPSTQRWGPRPIDLDLLLYDDRVVNEPDLSIPHPRLHERRFVLQPLAQLAPEVIHPVLRKTVTELLATLPA